MGVGSTWVQRLLVALSAVGLGCTDGARDQSLHFLSDDQLDSSLVIAKATLSPSVACAHMERCTNFDGSNLKYQFIDKTSFVGSLPDDMLSSVDIDFFPGAARYGGTNAPQVIVASRDVFGPGGSGTLLCGVSADMPVMKAGMASIWIVSKGGDRLIDLVGLRALEREYPSGAKATYWHNYDSAAASYSAVEKLDAAMDAIARSVQRSPGRASFSDPGVPYNSDGRACSSP